MSSIDCSQYGLLEWKHLSLLTCMSLAMLHIPGDGRLDAQLDNELDPSVCQLRTCSIHIRMNMQPSAMWYGMCSAHQTPAQLYQPAWGYHGLSFHSPTLNHLQMLWRVSGLCPSRRQWGCAPTVQIQNLIWNVEHIHVNSFPSGKTLPLPTSWTNPTAIKFIQHYLIRDMYRISTL